VLAAKANTDAYKYDVRSAWGWYLPSLTLGYSYSWGNNYFNDLAKDVFNLRAENSGASLRLSLGFSIFDGFTRERNMSRAKAGLSNARYQATYTRNSVIKAIEDAHLGVRLADQKLTVTEETEKSAQEDFDLVQAKYNLGAAAQWELLDAQVSLSQAQFNTSSAEFDYNLALAKLQNAMGK
jgi:outer membrane protein TolC